MKSPIVAPLDWDHVADMDVFYTQTPLAYVLAHDAQEQSDPASPVGLTSIVIPVFNALNYTQACVKKVYEVQTTVPFEVIIVDNGSSDGTEAWLEEARTRYENLTAIRLSENLGFSGGVNTGILQARGDTIVILNNDTLVTAGWLDRLAHALARHPEVGIVSPVTNYVGSGPQIDHKAVDLEPEQIDAYASTIQQRSALLGVPDRLVFFCVALKRELIEAAGLLDTGYKKGNFEDDDYCLRARMAGYTLAIVPNSFVFHHGTKTFQTNKIDHSQYMERNRIRFLGRQSKFSTAQPVPHSTQRPGGDPDISVIVRTIRPATIENALSSLAHQTFRNFEVVVVNDGSQEFYSVIEPFEQFFQVQYVKHEAPRGRTAALNSGLKAARAKWIAYLDDDDIIYPWHLEVLWLQASHTPTPAVFYTDYNRAFLDKRTTEGTTLYRQMVPSWEYDRGELLVGNRIPLHTLLHPNSLDTIGLYDETLNSLEDWEYLIRLSQHYNFVHIPRNTCEYRFFLDASNSIVGQTHEIIRSLKILYRRYSVTDPYHAYLRQSTLQRYLLLDADLRTLAQNFVGADSQQQVELGHTLLARSMGFLDFPQMLKGVMHQVND